MCLFLHQLIIPIKKSWFSSLPWNAGNWSFAFWIVRSRSANTNNNQLVDLKWSNALDYQISIWGRWHYAISLIYQFYRYNTSSPDHLPKKAECAGNLFWNSGSGECTRADRLIDTWTPVPLGLGRSRSRTHFLSHFAIFQLWNNIQLSAAARWWAPCSRIKPFLRVLYSCYFR